MFEVTPRSFMEIGFARSPRFAIPNENMFFVCSHPYAGSLMSLNGKLTQNAILRGDLGTVISADSNKLTGP